ncbi:MAG: beta-ketoacyl-ACP synthase II [Candidatus Poribacteria bacterium]
MNYELTKLDNVSSDDNLFNIIASDDNWNKSQSIIRELIGKELFFANSNNFVVNENYPEICHWIQNFRSMKEKCSDCHLSCYDNLSNKLQIIRCHIGLTYFAIKLSHRIVATSIPIVCDEFDIDEFKKYIEESQLLSDEGLELINEIRHQNPIKRNQLQLISNLIDSLLEPLSARLSKEVSVIKGEKFDLSPQTEKRKERASINILRPRKTDGHRAVITGIGVVSPIGIGNEAFLEGLLGSKNGVHRIKSFDPSDLPSQMAGEVMDFVPSKYMDNKTLSHTARASQFAIAGTQMALEDAGINLDEENEERIAVIIGTGTNGMEFASEQCYIYITQGRKRVSPYSGIIVFAGACSGAVSMRFGFKGLSHTISTGCSSANDAIGSSLRFIRSGEADIIITGGSDAAITPLTITAFSALRALSTRNEAPQEASRPFDKERDGFVIGEGSAIFVMEELNHALRRGAHIYAEVLGYGATNDCYHIVKPAPDGLSASRAIYLALEDAKLSPSDIEYVNAHGSSTPLNDKTETLISRIVFGKHAFSDRFAISSIKSQIGHALGSASAIGIAASLLGMEHGFLPPTINYKVFDPECDLNYVPNEPVHRKIQFFLSNSFAFTGKNSCLILGKFLDK